MSKNYVKRTDEEEGIYNAWDCLLTARSYQKMIKEPELNRVRHLYETHRKLSNIAARMNTRGIFVSRDNLNWMVHCLDQEIAEKSKAFLNIVNIDGMRCTPDDMRALLYKRHANERVSRFNIQDPVNPKMYTDEDKLDTISVDEASLLLLMTSGDCPPEAFPIIDAFWEAETVKKRRQFLVSQKLLHAIGPDGYLRPGWNSCGTDTMRFSCKDPNIMQLEQMLRFYMVPPEGWAMVHADKSQLELRVMAAVADDYVLQKYLDTGDVYSEDAKDWFDLPREMNVKKLKPKARQASKIIHLASQYAAGVPTIWAQCLKQDRSFTYANTRMLNNGFKKTYYRTVQYWHEEMARVMGCAYSEGRLLQGRRYYPKPPPINEVANWPIQRTASEMMAMEMIELDKRVTEEVPDAYIGIILHDAFDVMCREEDVTKTAFIMREVMDREYEIEGRKRSFPVEFKVAYSSENQTWADV